MNAVGVMQTQARGVDRNFRLFREDQVAAMRTAIAEADSGSPSGPRPIKFANVRMEGILQPVRDGPHFVISFDIPARIKNIKPHDVVRTGCAALRTLFAFVPDISSPIAMRAVHLDR